MNTVHGRGQRCSRAWVGVQKGDGGRPQAVLRRPRRTEEEEGLGREEEDAGDGGRLTPGSSALARL